MNPAKVAGPMILVLAFETTDEHGHPPHIESEEPSDQPSTFPPAGLRPGRVVDFAMKVAGRASTGGMGMGADLATWKGLPTSFG
jgi:hypothetical protein